MVVDEQEHIRMLRETLRRFVEAEMPRAAAARWDRDNHFPRDVFDRLAQLGVMGLTIPEDHGGAGRDIVATMVVIEELSRRSLAVSVPYIMAACYAGMNLLECGSERQKRELLPEIAAGRLLFAYGWSEPDVGADLASVRTTVRRDGDTLVINGHKRFCSGSEICDYIYTLARSGPADRRYANLSFVLVPPDAEGVTISRIESLGMKGAATTDVQFNEVRIPAGNLVGEEEAGTAAGRCSPAPGSMSRSSRSPRSGWALPRPRPTTPGAMPRSGGSSASRFPPTSPSVTSWPTCAPA